MKSDTEAIHALNGNNQLSIDEAFKYLYEKYCRLVYFCIYTIVKIKEDAEELTNDTFIKVFNHKKNILLTKNFKYYLLVTAKNLAYDFVKKKKLDVELNDEYIFECVKSEEQPKELSEILEQLNTYVDKNVAYIIVNHVIYAETFDKIAINLGMPLHSVKNKYFRGIKKLRDEMRD